VIVRRRERLKSTLYKIVKDTKLKITPPCFGSYVIHHQGVQSRISLKLLVVIHRYFVVCLVRVWQCNFDTVVCVAGRTIHTPQEGQVGNEFGRVNLGIVKTEFSVALPIGPDTVAVVPFLDPGGTASLYNRNTFCHYITAPVRKILLENLILPPIVKRFPAP
jgi:hypothetical protein